MPEPVDHAWPNRPPAEPPWLPPGHPGLGQGAYGAPPPAEGPVPGEPMPSGPRTGGRGPLVVAVVVVAVLALVTGSVAVRALTGPGEESGSRSRTATSERDPARPPAWRPSPSTTPTPTAPNGRPPTAAPAGPGGSTADPAVVEAELRVLKRYVEQVRGQTFTRDVAATVLDPSAFQAAVRAAYDEDREEIATGGELLRAAGLVPPAYDVVAGGAQLIGESALGYYDPRTGQLVVRSGGAFTPYLRHVLVHELTHALDDQRFGLDRPDLDQATDGRDWAFAALVEGTASWVAREYQRGLTQADQSAFAREQTRFGMEQQSGLSGVPLVLARLQTTPYEYGEPFVRALVDRGGTIALDTAYRQPPDTSEQIADISRYYAGDAALPVAAPPAEGALVDEGTLGLVMTALVLHGRDTNALGALMDPSGDPQALADLLDRLARGETSLADLLGGSATGGFGPLPAVPGWGGDHFVVYRPAAGGVCLRADWRMDSPAALGELTTELQAWATGDGRAQVSQPEAGLVRATRCAPPG